MQAAKASVLRTLTGVVGSQTSQQGDLNKLQQEKVQRCAKFNTSCMTMHVYHLRHKQDEAMYGFLRPAQHSHCCAKTVQI